MQGAKTRGFSGRNLMCNLTELIFEFIKSASCGGLAVSEDVVIKNLGFTGVDKAQADDAARGPPDVGILNSGFFRTWFCPYERRQDTRSLLVDIGVTGLMIRGPPIIESCENPHWLSSPSTAEIF